MSHSSRASRNLQPQALEYFAEISRSGSLRQASETFDIVPSAISRQIAQLEHQLGVQLFERHTRGMTPTEAGKVLLAHVDQNERQLDALRGQLDDLSALRRGTVRLAVVEAVAHRFLPSAIADFSRHHPGIEFQVSVCGTNQVAERLLSNAADIAMAFNSPSRDDLMLRARIAQPLQLVCAPGHPLVGLATVAMTQLDGMPAALPDRSFGIRRLVDRAQRAAGIRLKIMLQSDSLQLIKNVVSATSLVTFMPPMTFTRELANGTLHAIDLPEATFARASIDVITARGPGVSLAAKQFLETLVAQARDRG
jgi:DNA-binding transcriptional LysR family regulator